MGGAREKGGEVPPCTQRLLGTKGRGGAVGQTNQVLNTLLR